MALTPQQIQQMNQITGLNKPLNGAQAASQSRIAQLTQIANSAKVAQRPSVVEQVKSTASTAGNSIRDAFNSGINQAKEGVQGLAAGEFPLEPALKVGAGAINAATAPLAPVFSPIEKGVEYVANKVSDIPTVQQFAQSKAGETTQRVAEDIANANTIAGAVAGVKGAPEIAGKTQEVASDIAHGAGVVKNSLQDALTPSVVEDKPSSLSPSFTENLNKAFPPNKKELALGDKRATDAQTVFSDMVANKEATKIQDENGDIKAPSQYTFQDVLDAQNARMPQIYKDYTSKLSGIDKDKFNTAITETVSDAVSGLDKQIAKENSVPDRKAMERLKEELGGLRDTSPLGMQDYLQKLGQRTRAVGGVLTQEQIQTANLAGKIKAGLDKAVESTGEEGYSAGRKLYSSYKTMQDAISRAALKELKSAPGVVDKLTNLGVTGEGIQFLLTHNPASLAAAAGLKGVSLLTKYLQSPNRALNKIFNEIESHSKNPSPSSPK